MLFLSRFVLPGCLFLAVTNSTLAQPVALSANSGSMVASRPDSRAWTDPALNHNRLLIQKNDEGSYKQIGPYKVKGSPYLFGEKQHGDVFAKGEYAVNILISYNTFNQEIEFNSSGNPAQALVKETGEVDSFTIQQNPASGINEKLSFIYGFLIGTTDKSYYQLLFAGPAFSLYKKYKSQLTISTTSYVDAQLREFEMVTEYYYSDSAKNGLIKLKLNAKAVKKEFKPIKDITGIMDQSPFIENPEAVLKSVFEVLNK